MKKFYNQPEVLISRIETLSIICASGGSSGGGGFDIEEGGEAV